jgi:hypothetical protein
MKPHRGTLILILGILGVLPLGVFGWLAILAWVMGASDIKKMDAGTMDPSGRGSTNAGKICGIIGTILMILSIIAVVGFFLLFGFPSFYQMFGI